MVEKLSQSDISTVVNFEKWIFQSQPLSKVQFKGQKWNYQSRIFAKVQFQKTNFKRQISSRVSNVKFSKKRNFPNPIVIQIFKVKFRRSTRGYQSVLFKVHHSLKVKQFKFKRLKVKRFKVGFWQAHFKRQHFPSQVNYSFRFDREQTKKKKFDSKIGLQFAFFLSRENLVHQRAKNWLSINSDVRKIGDSPLPASSRRQSRATYDWLRWRSQHGPRFEETSKNWEKCGELRCGFRSTLIEAYHVPPYRLTLWFRTRSKQRRRLEEEKEKKNHMVPNSR